MSLKKPEELSEEELVNIEELKEGIEAECEEEEPDTKVVKKLLMEIYNIENYFTKTTEETKEIVVYGDECKVPCQVAEMRRVPREWEDISDDFDKIDEEVERLCKNRS